jgi:hypothetical protein
MMEELLASIDPKDKQKRKFAQILVREWLARAIEKSDLLLIEILNRLEGKLAPDTEHERAAEHEIKVLVADMPGPDLGLKPALPRVAVQVKVKK